MAILYPLLRARIVTFDLWNFGRFQQLLGISFFYTANTAFALFGLRGMNLSMYTAVKHLTPVVILVTKVSAKPCSSCLSCDSSASVHLAYGSLCSCCPSDADCNASTCVL
eukprot:GHUV01036547.1.p1 GENE.GHUV01036547.1~~GHUV01036547.1.p1  ORF type:complete len:110 (+),score=12.54 GHUV01036547.1:2-331(+)